MCDTVVVVRDGIVMFAKNSDRDPNEAQRLEWHPRREHSAGSVLPATWLTIPQARRTWATIISRPYWMWGAEMGANEHGVVIGNEAVFTDAAKQSAGLLGMDLLRLALERATSADEAADVIATLLAAHGQGGRCGYDDPSFGYDNSFVIADKMGALIVETAGREACRERVVRGSRAISNGLTIEPFAAEHADRLRSGVAQASSRRRRMETLCADATRAADMAAALRDHGGSDDPTYSPINGAMSAPCMHAGGLIANSQTVASWIAVLTPSDVQHYATATAAPCLSAFKPIAFGAPRDLGAPTGVAGDSGWWRFERAHRALIGDHAAAAAFRKRRDAWEAATWSGERSAEDAFAAWDAFVASLDVAAIDRRPAIVRRYWHARARDAAAHVPKLPARC